MDREQFRSIVNSAQDLVKALTRAQALAETRDLVLAQALDLALAQAQDLVLAQAKDLAKAKAKAKAKGLAKGLAKAKAQYPLPGLDQFLDQFLDQALELALELEEKLEPLQQFKSGSQSESNDSIEITIAVPEGISDEELRSIVRQAALHADSVHRSHGGDGLKIDSAEVFKASRVFGGVK